MRLIACSVPMSKADYGCQGEGLHTQARPAVHLKDVLDRFDLSDGHLLDITTDNASLNYSMTRQLQSALEAY
jgi:hypothetical protein